MLSIWLNFPAQSTSGTVIHGASPVHGQKRLKSAESSLQVPLLPYRQSPYWGATGLAMTKGRAVSCVSGSFRCAAVAVLPGGLHVVVEERLAIDVGERVRLAQLAFE